MKEWFDHWLAGETDVMENILDAAEQPDSPRAKIKEQKKELRREIGSREHTLAVIRAEQKGFYALYGVIAVVSCVALIGVLLYITSCLPRYGLENPQTLEVVRRYIEKGLEETGAVNIVAGLILDYRAFDTLGESHVLFTALVCSAVLLRIDSKNMQAKDEGYHTIRQDVYFDISRDSIIRRVGFILLPSILLFGIYILLNGQISPGGGFSGGAVMGAALILFAACFGFSSVDKFFTARVLKTVTAVALAFYGIAKGCVFFLGANGLENPIPKGIPGAIISGGLILPLNIAVGIVVACTMFGFYSLFRRGNIGGD